MNTISLMENWQYKDDDPNAEPLFVTHDSRVLRFALHPGQSIREHHSTNSPVYIVVLQGQGVFTGPEGEEKQVGPGTLIVFEVGENHTVRAQDEDLVFLTILHGVPDTYLT